MAANERPPREKEIFEQALDLASPEERAGFLKGACGHDAQLRERVEALLRASEGAEDFLPEKPVNSPPGTIAAIPEKPGDWIGRYKLLQQIGEGGCGVVYMAEQEEPVRRRVALKIIKLGMDTKQVIARFEAERQALALMDHPNIAKILDAGTMGQETGGRDQGSVEATPNLGPLTPDSRLLTPAQGRPYFVMELVRGIKITDYCDQHHLSTRERLDLFIQVCRAVQHAHQKGIIHRDLKPSNILVTPDDGPAAAGVPKVIDFGIAKATQGRLSDHTVFTAFEQFIGTPAYMSPEQAEMSLHDIDTRTDVYSLGVLLYELLTGRAPFDPKELLAAGLDAMRRIIREVEPIKPSTRLTQELAAADAVGRVAPRAPLGVPPSGGPERVNAGRQTADDAHGVTRPTSQPSTLNPQRLKQLIPALRGDLDWIVMKALEKDRARRYETANGLAADLTRHLNDEPVVARPPSRWYEFQKTVRRHKFGFAAAAAIMLVLAGGIALATWQALRARTAEQAQSRLRAEAEKAHEAAKTLSAWDIREATRLIAEDNTADAVTYLVQSLTLNPTNDAALTRLATLLEYRTWMLPTVELKLEGPVNSVEFNPDGTRFVTGLADGTARVWDARTGRAMLEPMKHASNVTSAQFSPDGERIVTTGSGTARVWEAETGQPVAELKDKGGPAVQALPDPIAHLPPLPPGSDGVRSLRVSASGKQLVTISEDNSIRLWDTHTGQPLTEPMKHSESVTSARFSPNGERIVTTSGGAASVWDARTGQPIAETWTRSNLIPPDGKRRLSILVGRIVQVMDVQTGQPLTEPMPHETEVSMTLFSPDGKRLLTVSRDNAIRVWDPQTGKPLTEPMPHTNRVTSAQFNPDAMRIVTTSGNTTRVWDVRTAQPLLEPMKHPSNVSSAQFSPDGKWIATAAGDTACVWDAQTGQPVAETFIRTQVITLDGKRRLSILLGRIVRVLNAQTGQPLTEPMPHEAEVSMTLFSSDGKRLLTVCQDNAVRVWDAQTGQRVTELKTESGPAVPAPPKPGGNVPPLPPASRPTGVFSVQFSPDGRLILMVSQDSTARAWVVRVWDAQTGRPLTEPMKHTNSVPLAQFSPNGQRIVTTSGDTARIWDAQTGQPVTGPIEHSSGADLAPLNTGPKMPPLPPGFPQHFLNSAQFSPDGKRIVTVSGGTAVRVWDAQTGHLLTGPMKHTNRVTSAQFDLDGKRIETFSRDNQVRVWDAQTGQLVSEYKKEGGPVAQALPDPNPHLPPVPTGSQSVVSVQFSPDSKRLVTVSRDNTVRVWEAQTGRLLTEPMKDINSIAAAQFSADGKRVETLSTDNQVRVWDAHTGQPLPELAKEGGPAAPPRPNPGASWQRLSMASDSNAMLSAQFSYDGKRLVTISRDNSVVLWDAQTGRPLIKPLRHTNEVSWAWLEPGYHLIRTFTKDNLLWNWDTETGERAKNYGWGYQSSNRVHAKLFREEGKRSVATVSGRTVRVLDTENAQPLTEPMPHDANVSIAQSSFDGQRVVTVATDNTLRVWQARTTRPRPLMAPFPMIYGGGATAGPDSEPQFTHDGRRVVMPSRRKTVCLWDALTGEPLAILSPADNPDSEWDVELGEPSDPVIEGGSVVLAQLSPDDQRLITTAYQSTDNPSEFRVWSVQTGQALTAPLKVTNKVHSAEFSPDGKRLLVTLGGGWTTGARTAQVWDAQTGRPLTKGMVHTEGVAAARFSSDGQSLLTASLDGTLQLWDALSAEPKGAPVKLGSAIDPGGWGREAQFSPDGQRLVTKTGRNTFRIWHVQTGQPLTEPIKLEPHTFLLSVRFSPDGKRIVTSCEHPNSIYVWDAQTGQPCTDQMMHPPLRMPGGSAQFSPDGRRILIGMLYNEASIWELAPSQSPGPAWLFQLAEALCGKVLSKAGALEPTPINRLEMLDRIRQKLTTEPDDDWVVWGRWLLADRATRTISPFSKLTIPSVVNRLIQHNTLPSLKEATELAPTNSTAWAGLAWLLKEQYPTLRNPGGLDQAESFARRAIKLDPANSTAWRTLSAVYSLCGRTKDALAAIERALQLQPTNALAWEVRGEILVHTNRLAEALAAFDRQVELQPASTNQAGWARRRALLNRADVLRRLGRWDEARREVSVTCGIAPRDPQASTNLIDLSAFYNAGLKENWPDDLRDNRFERYWREHSGYFELPMGVQTLAGTPFDVRGLVLLHGEGPCTRRAPVQVTGLPAPGKCRRVHFLHGTVRAQESSAAEVARYVFHFADDTTQERPMELAKDVMAWRLNGPSPVQADKEAPTPAWAAHLDPDHGRLWMAAQFYKTTWENPKPDVAITSIDFVLSADDASPFLVAITAE